MPTPAGSGPDHDLDFRLLGPVEAARNGRPLALGGPRQRGLLALLLLQPGRTVALDELIDALWHGEPPEAAPTTIRTYVSRLRAVLGDGARLNGNASGYGIEARPEAIDTMRFDRLVRAADEDLRRGRARGAAAQLAEALAMWRGRPFGELSTDGPLRVEADRLEELRLFALEKRLEAELRLGQAAAVVDELDALVAQHPYRERFWRLLMLALYHSGRQADALAAYHRARTTLDDELGIEPGEELRHLELAILRQEVEPLQPPEQDSNLPADLTTFIGRNQELDEISHLLREHRMVSLTGVAGVGKTRLALEIARRLLDSGESVWFVDLSAVTVGDAVEVELARQLQVPEHGLARPADQIGARLRHAELLLILDNCEHVREGAADVAERILGAAPGLRALATSRVPLGVPGEVDFPVPPLRLPPPDASAEELLGSEAVSLLLARARAAGTRQRVDESALATAARICRDLDGLPLAIELAAARAKLLSLDEIARRLGDRFKFLVSWRRLTSARHRTLREAIDWSYDLLPEQDQAAFARLSVFAGGFTLEAAAAVCFDDGDESIALDVINRLVDASLVVPETNSSPTRYRLLETIRQYSAERNGEMGTAGSVRGRHAEYFGALAQEAEQNLGGENQQSWLERLDAEHDNIRAALAYVAESGVTDALLKFTVALTRFWYVRGHLTEARQHLDRALEMSAAVDPTLLRRALTATASIALLQGDYGTAISRAEASLEASRRTGEQRLVANSLSNLGAIALAADDLERAGSLLAEAVELARTVGDERVLALALNNLGDHALTVGEYERAKPLFEESLALLSKRNDSANIARSQFNLGAVSLRLGQVDAAEARFRNSLAISRDVGDKEDLSWALLGLSAVAAARDDGERGAALLGAASGVLSAMGAELKPFERTLHQETEARLRAGMHDGTFEAARARGAAMPLADVVRQAMPD